MEKPIQNDLSAFETVGGCVLVQMYAKGKLGDFPVGENRLRAGLLFMKDYRFSMFSQKTTMCYDALFVRGAKGKNEISVSRQDAADRYLNALKAVDKYQVYALHFLRDEKNIHSFLQRYPVLNQGSKRTYKMVYLAINKMLDKLVSFYDSEKR